LAQHDSNLPHCNANLVLFTEIVPESSFLPIKNELMNHQTVALEHPGIYDFEEPANHALEEPD